MDHQLGVSNQADFNVLLTFGTRAGQILEQVGDAHIFTVRYEGLHGVGLQTYPTQVLGNYFSFLPD